MKLNPKKIHPITSFKSPKFSGILTPFCNEDLPELSQLYGDSETMKYLGGSLTLSQVETVLGEYIQQSRRFPFGPNAIRDAQQKQLMGRTGLRVSNSEQIIEVYPANGSNITTCFCLKNKVQLGYVIHPKFRHQGIATQAAKAVLDFGFRSLKINEICAFMRAENYGSVVVARDKLNMTLLGNLVFNDDLWFYYSLTREAYLKR
jgi:ribosomal-protein-alanine N-acetyltransferase